MNLTYQKSNYIKNKTFLHSKKNLRFSHVKNNISTFNHLFIANTTKYIKKSSSKKITFQLKSRYRVEDDPNYFDNIVLDEAHYKEMGLDKEEIEKNPPWDVKNIDPEGYDLTMDSFVKIKENLPQYLKDSLENAKFFGPEVILIAGFKVEEFAMIRGMVDSIGGHKVKVIPVREDMLHEPAGKAVYLPEPEWDKPRPIEWSHGGGWGSQRAIVFGGLKIEYQALIVEVLEENGMVPICVTAVAEETKHILLGELIADSIRVQRDRKNPDKQVWDVEGRVAKELPDLDTLYQSHIQNRVQTIRDGLESGEATLEKASDGTLRVKMDGLDENIIDPDDIYKGVDNSNVSKRKKDLLKQIDLDEMMDELYGNGNSTLFPEIDDDVEIIFDNKETDHQTNNDTAEINNKSSNEDNKSLHEMKLNDEKSEINNDVKKEVEMEDDGFIDDFEPHKVEYLGNGMTRSVIFDGGIINAHEFLKEKFDFDDDLSSLDISNNDKHEKDNNNMKKEQKQDIIKEESNLKKEEKSFENINMENSLKLAINMALSRGINSKDLENVINALTIDNITITEKMLNERKKMDLKTNGRRKSLNSNKNRIKYNTKNDQTMNINDDILVNKSDIDALYPTPIDSIDDTEFINKLHDNDKSFNL